jgi:exodeoxyribonuclease VII large subunit
MAETVQPLSQKTLRVTELTRYLKYLVEGDNLLSAVSVHGEVSQLSRSSSGHVYFTLKDESSQVSCVLFRREALRQGEDIKDMKPGAAVVVHGFLTVYEPRGTFQIYVERVIPQGDGALFQQFERLRARLEGEGLFASERKRALPSFPRTLALVTSPGSQAYHDVLHRLRTQYPFVRVIEVGVSVQGDGAADEVAMALDIVNRLTEADLILLVRGGGAPEELAVFNDERMARAIFASRIPVVTGIGHETDSSIADFVADHRAATPSLAAAAAVPDVQALVRRTADTHAHLKALMGQRLRSDRRRWLEVNRALVRASPRNTVRAQRKRFADLTFTSDRTLRGHFRAKRARLEGLRGQLKALDPLAILGRGYALLTDSETGRIVSRVEHATSGRLLTARVSDGEFSVRIEDHG